MQLQLVLNALMWLKINNPLYDNIICIDIDNIDKHLKTLQQNYVSSEDSALNNDIHSTALGDTNSNNENGGMIACMHTCRRRK